MDARLTIAGGKEDFGSGDKQNMVMNGRTLRRQSALEESTQEWI